MTQIKSIVNGYSCFFRESEFNENWEKHNINYICPICNSKITNTNYICPICNSEITVGQKTYIILNNNLLFPNTLIHKSCIVNDMTKTARTLMYSYNSYRKELNEINTKYKGWSNK